MRPTAPTVPTVPHVVAMTDCVTRPLLARCHCEEHHHPYRSLQLACAAPRRPFEAGRGDGEVRRQRVA